MHKQGGGETTKKENENKTEFSTQTQKNTILDRKISFSKFSSASSDLKNTF